MVKKGRKERQKEKRETYRDRAIARYEKKVSEKETKRKR